MRLFFFKQKTAYEMRISDGSSDVCSSDLGHAGDAAAGRAERLAGGGVGFLNPSDAVIVEAEGIGIVESDARCGGDRDVGAAGRIGGDFGHGRSLVGHRIVGAPFRAADQGKRHRARQELVFHEDSPRSEEHTSELQSLMRISYAVFCLKKKKKKKQYNTK